ncbi:hypothetical protein DL764_004180 [Monosporascus ibericus]|uniref:Uncharacterized protein n=1 Tax=Monosporascus ibericus TaxID=155417 RepID=A0A4Q4TH69_9PEZI|nr:hypothetical protein DL764_004180 [Monosporascus ibericus]
MSSPPEAKPNNLAPEGENAALGSKLAEMLPTPANTQPVADPANPEGPATTAEGPSLSHALAAADDYEEKGTVQLHQYYGAEVIDLGWNEKKEEIVSPLVGGLGNEDLWLLIRRFNKQVYHVKEVVDPLPGNLDLNIAEDEEFSPDKLRANVERLYMTVLICIMNAIKHIARIRSWKETKRTSCFCAAYFVAWLFDFIMPLFITTLIVLIAYPPSRSYLFPPAPVALVDSHSGGIQKPKAGVLGSHDSATGAPENHKGEAVEQEASNFFNGFTSVVLTSATGKHPEAEPNPEETALSDEVPDPAGITTVAAQAKDVASRGEPGPEKDKTRVPVENTIWLKMRPVMHGIATVSDAWERLGNALSPTPPFPRDTYRIRLAAAMVPLLLMSLFVSSYMFVKGATFGFGFAFFGDPIIARGVRILNGKFPHWQKILELRNTLLKGVPTNAQLTLTLLRIGEANKAPLPPPPRIQEVPPDHPAELTGEHLNAAGDERPFNASENEVRQAIEHDPSAVPHLTGDPEADTGKNPKHGHKMGGKILGFFKGMTRGAVKASISADHARAKAGSQPAKNRLGAVSDADSRPPSGPVEFEARHKGHRGHVYITTESTIPAVGFSPEKPGSKEKRIQKHGDDGESEVHAVWSIPIADIAELKKIGGYGWKGKLVVGWSLGREINDGLEITDRRGNTVRVTAVPLRDELFNRLVAIGRQKWEAW